MITFDDKSKPRTMNDVENQIFMLEQFLINPELYKRCLPAFDVSYFDGCRGIARVIRDYFAATATMPSIEYVNMKMPLAKLKIRAPLDTDMMTREYEQFAITKAHENAIYEGVTLIKEGKHDELKRRIEAAAMISLTRKSNRVIMTIDDCDAAPATEWLLQNVWLQGSILNLYGDSNTGKTWIAVDIACRIATNMKWSGQAVNRKGGKVIYVAAESPTSVKTRVADWAALNNAKDALRDDLRILQDAVDLLDPLSVKSFINDFRDEKVECVIIDTLACSTGSGENENNNSEMAKVVANIKLIRDELDCSVMVLHHPTKAGGTERGGGAYKAGIDASIKLTVDESNDEYEILKLNVEKQRDGECVSRYFRKERIISPRFPERTTIRISPHDVKAERANDFWNKAGKILAKGEPLRANQLIKKVKGVDTNASSKQLADVKEKFIDGRYETMELAFVMNEKEEISLCFDK